MKILQVAPYFTPYVGGQERYIHNLSKYLVKYGNEVDIATSNYPLSNPTDVMDGFTVRRYHCLARPIRNPITPTLVSLNDTIDSYDIIHAHNEHAFSSMIASQLAAKHHIPFVITCHGRLISGNNVIDLMERAYMATVARGIFNRANVVCVNSPLDKEYISRVGSVPPSKIHELSNAVDPAHFSALKNGVVREEIKGITETSQYKVLFVGNLIKRKGVETLVRAFGHVSKTNPQQGVSLILVGDGEEKQHIQKLVDEYGIRDKVHIVGSVTDAELSYLYDTSDVLVLPSLSEVCPTVVLEAMHHGLPVITTDIPGIKDHFKDTACLVPPQDPLALAEMILTLINQEELSSRMSEAGKELILQKYTWDKIAHGYQSVYGRVIDTTPMGKNPIVVGGKGLISANED